MEEDLKEPPPPGMEKEEEENVIEEKPEEDEEKSKEEEKKENGLQPPGEEENKEDLDEGKGGKGHWVVMIFEEVYMYVNTHTPNLMTSTFLIQELCSLGILSPANQSQDIILAKGIMGCHVTTHCYQTYKTKLIKRHNKTYISKSKTNLFFQKHNKKDSQNSKCNFSIKN